MRGALVHQLFRRLQIPGDKLPHQRPVGIVKIFSANINVGDRARQLRCRHQHVRTLHRPLRPGADAVQVGAKAEHVRRHRKAGGDTRVITERLHRRTRPGECIEKFHLDVIPTQLGRLEHVVEHAYMRPALLHRHRLALQVGHLLDAFAGDHVVTGRPGHLQDHHALGARVGADHLRRLPHHAKCAPQERRLAGAIIAHLLDEIVAWCQVQVESLFLKNSALLGLETAIGVKRRHVAAPDNERHLQRAFSLHRAHRTRPD